MLLQSHQPNQQYIPSFESIDFKLTPYPSKNSINQQIKYQPISLTFTNSYQDLINSSIDYNNHEEKQNRIKEQQTPRIRKSFTKKNNHQLHQTHSKHYNYHQQISSSPHKKITQSIINIHNLELFVNSNLIQTPIKSKNHNRYNQYQKLSSQSNRNIIIYNRNRTNSRQRKCTPAKINQKKPYQRQQQGKLIIQNEQHTASSPFIRKSSQSSIKTQNKSVITAITRSLSRQRITSSHLTNQLITRSEPRMKRAVSDRYFERKLVDKNRDKIGMEKVYVNVNGNIKNKNIIGEDVLNELINIKSIKLESNAVQSKAYLRKIIQNRVSSCHYVQDGGYGRRS